ncbi:MAG TPA: alpha/beta hydrolase [Xanthobacteraceae bacterium]|nr:alpha/beta hydrolase [Xanthobacteraceae bacterium]
MSAASLTRITSGGVALLHREASRGAQTLALLHGIGSNAESFRPLIDALDPAFGIVAWDAPGYGDSIPLAPAWPDASDYAAVLAALLDRLDVPRAVILGHSLGALVAGRFAATWPQRTALLVVVSPALGYQADPGQPLPASVAKRLDDLDRLGPQAFAAARAPGLVSDPAAYPRALASVQAAMAAVKRPGYDQATRMLGSGDLLADMARIIVPALVMTGDADRLTPPDNAARAFAALSATLPGIARTIPGGGHAVLQEQPQPAAAFIAEAIATMAATDPRIVNHV